MLEGNDNIDNVKNDKIDVNMTYMMSGVDVIKKSHRAGPG